MITPVEPQLKLLTRGTVQVGPAQIVGPMPLGERRVVPILGGVFEGRLSGEVIPGGADWQIVTPEGVAFLEARYTVRTREGALIYICNKGIRHAPPSVMSRLAKGEEVGPAEYYCRTTTSFETGNAACSWINRIVAISSVARLPSAVVVEMYEVL
jgi:hypothetical protein